MTMAPTLPRSIRSTLLVSALVAASVLAACGKKEGGATQVAAKVNKEEISVHQINFVLQRTPGIQPAQAQVASKRILEGLIDQELAVQQAHEQKLDREPNVVMAIEAARREVLARAYADKLASSAAKPTDAEVQQYFTAHPGLFAQRRVYVLNEIGVEADAASRSQLIPKLQGVTSADQATGVLRAAGVKFAQRQVNQVPENLPLPMVDKMAAMNEGQFIVTPSPNGFSMVFVASAKPAPVTLEQAKAPIEAFIVNDRKRTLVADGMKALRGEAKIEYMGQFAGGAASAPADAPPATPAPAAAPAASGLDAGSLQKGLSGLK